MSETRYWRCTECSGVYDYATENPTWCEICDEQDVVMEPVAVLPLATYEALQRLRAAVEDDVFEHQYTYENSDDGHLGDYRDALRRRMEDSK